MFNKFSKASSQSETDEEYQMALKWSLFVSADMAHAQHPNYSGKHQ